MQLLLPKASLSEERISLVIQVGLVLPLQTAPCLLSLGRGQLRVLIDDMLELIHHTAVRNKRSRILQMHFHVILRSVAEEQVHPLFREKFHGHGMDLCSLHADIRMLSDRILCSEIPLKRMTTLMRDDVHITAGTVKVSEDKRCMVQRQISHVTASFLGLAAQYVKQLVLHHEIKEFRSLRGQFPVHLLACCHDLFRGAGGRRVAILEIYLLVNIAELLQTQTLSSAVMQLLCKGYEILLDLPAESFYLVLAVAVAVHAVIAQFQIIFISHGSGLRGTVFHQFIVDGIQLFLIFQEKRAHLLPCLSADIAVGIHQIGP